MITPLGSTVEKTWNGVVAGKSGIGPITRFDPAGLETPSAGEVRDFDPLDYMDRKEIRRSDRFVHFAVAAAGQALKSARLEITSELAPRIGVAFGSGIGGVETLVEQVLVHHKDPRRVSPFLIPMMIIDMAAGEIAMKYRAKGPNMGHVSACASSANAIGEAAEIIRRGQADVMLAGGSEAGLIKIAIGAFNQARALSTRNDAPERASRPFDKDRDGFVFSEGAGCLVLEELEFARARGATVLAEFMGYGMSGHTLGAAGAIEAALCILGMQNGILPPTINQETRDPDCDLDYIPNRARKAKVDLSLSNSMGFGGHNVALVIRRDAA